MTTTAGKALNRSAHTLTDLKKYAKSASAAATRYLKDVERELKAAGQTDPAKAVHALLADKTGSLAARIEEHKDALLGVFPADAAGWNDLQQTQRAQTLGWAVGTAAPDQPAKHITGKLEVDPNWGPTLVADNGRTYKLLRSPRVVESPGLSASWMVGLKDDGPLSLQGTLGEDGETFSVEGFALNRDGKFDTFTFGRVSVTKPVVVSTPRGNVEIADARLAKKLAAMPRLGVILPGAPEETRDGRLIYRGNPREMFGLGRFSQTTVTGTGATRTAHADMAYSVFNDKPVSFPARQAERVDHTQRLWFRGNVTMSGDEAAAFRASYVSLATDGGGVSLGYAGADADPIQFAVMTDAG